MGVKDLWGIISPTGEVLSLPSLHGKIVAIDLSCWICDSQNVSMGRNVIRPHLRNLFFRAASLIRAGILPVFVLEGDAPVMKFNTIQNRIDKRTDQSKFKGSSNKNLGKRSRLKGLITQCRQFLTLVGLPWIQASGEAEATCAALEYYQLVDGVITQDSDVFLYGASVVYRNFTGDQSKATVEQFNLGLIEKRLALNRENLVCLALLLGCDYIPAGVPGVGKDIALKLLNYWKKIDIENPIERLKNWTTKGKICGSTSINNLIKWDQSVRDEDIENKVKEKALKTIGFPFNDVIDEFTKKLEKPKVNIKWSTPHVANLVMWCIEMLGWEAEYSFEKVAPIATRWILSNSLPSQPSTLCSLKPRNISRKCVRNGVPSFEVVWDVGSSFAAAILSKDVKDEVRTIESSSCFEKSYPLIVSEYLEASQKPKAKKKIKDGRKSKKVSSKKKTPGSESNKENLSSNFEDLFKDVNDSVSESELSKVISAFIDLTVDTPLKELQPPRSLNIEQTALFHSCKEKIHSKELKKNLEAVSESKGKKLASSVSVSERTKQTCNSIPFSCYEDSEKSVERQQLSPEQCIKICPKAIDCDDRCSSPVLNTQICDNSSKNDDNELTSKQIRHGNISDDLFEDSYCLSGSDYNQCSNSVSSEERFDSNYHLAIEKNNIKEQRSYGTYDSMDIDFSLLSFSTPFKKDYILTEGKQNYFDSSVILDDLVKVTPLKTKTFSTEFENQKAFESPVIENLSLADRMRKKFDGKLDSIIDSL